MNKIQNFLSGGAGYAIIALIGAASTWGFADHYYDKGMADCREAQIEVDGEAEDIGNMFGEIKEAIDENHDAEVEGVVKEYRTGLSYNDIQQARQEGINHGRELERAKQFNQSRDENPCLRDFYSDDSGLQDSARSLQRDIFEGGSKGD